MKFIKNHKASFLFASWIFLFFLFRWNSFNAPFERDEGAYAYVAREMREGHLPYETVFDHKPPLIYLVYYLSQSISIDALWAPRLFSSIFLVSTIFVIGEIVKIEFGKKYFWPTIFFAIPMFSLPLLTPFAANTEIFMNLPLVISLYLFVSEKKKPSKKRLFLFGSLSSMSLMFKPLGILVFPFIALIWLINIHKRKGVGGVLVAGLQIIFGLFLTTFLILLPFLMGGSLDQFYEQVVVYSRNSVYGSILPRRLLKHSFLLFKNWPLLFLLGGWYLFKRPKDWWFYAVLVVLSLVTVFNAEVGHYYLLIIPFWVIITISSIKSLSEFVSKRFELKKGWVFKALFSIVLLSLFIPVFRLPFISPDRFTTYVYGKNQPFEEAVMMGEQIKRITEKNDRVYIAGFEPEILFYADRKSASKFIYAYPLFVRSPLRENYLEEMQNELISDLPRAVVMTSDYFVTGDLSKTREPVKFWNELIGENYHIVGGVERVGDEVSWRKSESINDLNKAELLLFKYSK